VAGVPTSLTRDIRRTK